MKTIDDVLNKLKQERALMGEPATADDLERCQKAMADNGFAPIPQEYLDFLTKCNGLEFDGSRYSYGTDKVPSHNSDYALMDIVSANIRFTKNLVDEEDYVVLGDGECDVLYLYNIKNGRYEVDMYGPIREFDTYEAMFINEFSRYFKEDEK